MNRPHLGKAWADLRSERPELRIRYAAAQLGVSEAELLATRVGDGAVRRIDADPARLLPRLGALGPLMALTRNDLFVHEKTGIYENVYVDPHVASVIGEAIDLRVFPARWVHGFSVAEEGRGGPKRSLQVFDAHGTAVHKVFLREGADVGGYRALVDDLLLADAGAELAVEPPAPAHPEPPDGEVDAAALEADWRAMKNTHDFHGLLRSHGVSRTQALRLVPEALARPVGNGGLRTVLEGASRDAVPLMVFVRSPGTIQIHHGPIVRLKDTPGWLNVLDPGFQLHVREGDIRGTWVVRKPTETGWVTSVEIFDGAGELCAILFGVRGEGAPEDGAWAALASGLA